MDGQTDRSIMTSMKATLTSVFICVSSGWSADLLQHGQVSDRPALEGGSSVTLNLYELIILSFWSVNIGHLYKKERNDKFQLII